MAQFVLRAQASAPPSTVFDVLTDHRGYARISALRASQLEREGDPAPNGVGAIRVLNLAGPPLREEVTLYEPPGRFAYRLLSGLPVEHHTGEVLLAGAGNGTAITYTVESRCRLPVPDRLWGLLVRPVIQQLLKAVVKESERRTSARSVPAGTPGSSAS